MSTGDIGKIRGIGIGRQESISANPLPDLFNFVTVQDATVSTLYTSNEDTVAGIAGGEAGRVLFTVTNGTLVKNNVDQGNSGYIELGDVVKLKCLSSDFYETSSSAGLLLNGSPFVFFEVITGEAVDNVPDPISFTPYLNAPIFSYVNSANVATITGIDPGTIGRCSFSVTNGSLYRNAGVTPLTSGYFELGDTVRMRGISSQSFSAQTATILNINGLPFAEFLITTRPPYDITPDPLVFTALVEVPVSTIVTSNSQSITGVDAGAEGQSTFTVTNGTLIKNGVNAGSSGTLRLGDVVSLTATSSSIYSTEKIVKLSINGMPFSEWSIFTIMAIGFYADYCPGSFNTVRCTDAR